MKDYNVIIIDSGIDEKHEAFGNISIDALQVVRDDDQELHILKQHSLTYGHGTAVTSVIANENDELNILSINVLNTTEFETDEETLIFTLSYILNNCSPAVINMSLGITCCEDKLRLRNICTKLVEHNFILVSAFDNDGMFAFPATFEMVIGVRSCDSVFMADEYEMYNDSVVNIGGFGRLQRVAWNNNRYILLGGNSLACAQITRIILYFLMKKHVEPRNIMHALKKNAREYFEVEKTDLINRNSELPFAIHKAAIFPFNKEMHSLLRFADLLPFQICDVYDSKYSMRVGGYTDRLLNNPNVKSIRIKNIEDISFHNIDTIILGHMQEVLQFPNMLAIYDLLIEKIKNSKLNVYSFDDLRGKGVENLYYPYVAKEDMPPRRFGMQYRTNKPVVGVFGTSSKQGKFTLQLLLRGALQKLGYNIGQLGTEPSSLLFGMDDVFPIGYNALLEIKGIDSVIYLNNHMERIAEKDNDIIIVGCQSGTVTYDLYNAANCCFSQYEFLVGTQPDVVFLCINPFDEMKYVKRTIAFIESSVDCEVLGLVIFPMHRKKDWSGNFGKMEKIHQDDISDLKKRISEASNKDVYILGDENDLQCMIDSLINKLSEGS